MPPRAEMAQRYQQSGKEKLIALVVSDFDPEGEQIAQSFARSMRDDFEVADIEAIKVALTAEQVSEFALSPAMKAKKTSANYKKFAHLHGDDVYELEALEPTDLQNILRETIDSVIDIPAFNAEVDAEKQDAAFLDQARRRAQRALADILENPEGPET